MTDRKHRLQAGEIVQRTWQDYFDTCQRVIAAFGRDRLVEDLRPDDFLDLRGRYAKGRSPSTVSNEVQRIRTLFNFAFQADLVEKPIKFGPTFKRPAKRILRKARQEKGPRMFHAAEIRTLLRAASVQLRAMILLGINCGFGNTDCGRLKTSSIKDGWVDHPRPKTSVQRRCPLWPETRTSLDQVLNERKAPKTEDGRGLLFVTRYGQPWHKNIADSPVTKEFRKLLGKHKLHRPGLGFYALRRTFETIAGDSRDRVAVDHIMGHARDDMASVYRERIEDARLVAVTDHVHRWLFGEGQS